MTYEDSKAKAKTTVNSIEEQDNIAQQLLDAKNEIAELKMQIAWLERSYE